MQNDQEQTRRSPLCRKVLELCKDESARIRLRRSALFDLERKSLVAHATTCPSCRKTIAENIYRRAGAV